MKSGKEATVFLCKGGPSADAELVALKVYRSNRSFQNRAGYQHGRAILDTRMGRAMAVKSRYGRHAAETLWVEQEFDMLCRLYAAGADVPRPIELTGKALLMGFFGDEAAPAPQLREVSLTRSQASGLSDQLLGNIELFLANGVVHGDLSPFNVLVRNGRAAIIDLPRAVNAATNANAATFLARDVDRICAHFHRYGVAHDAPRLSRDLWRRFEQGRL